MRTTTRTILSTLAMLPLLTLQACATPRDTAEEATVTDPPSAPAKPADGTARPGAFTLQVGASHEVAGAGSLRYERLVNDSRCPPDRQCVWAGDAIVAFSWTPTGGAAERFELHTGLEPRSKTLGGGRTLVLEALTRGAAPAATLRIDAAP